MSEGVSRPNAADLGRRTGRRWSSIALVSATILAAYIVVALIGPWISPYDPNALGVGPPLSPPTTDHWFGTDELGRDQLSRCISAVRVAMVVGFSSVGIALVIGGCFGIVAGYLRGKTDTVTMTRCESPQRSRGLDHGGTPQSLGRRPRWLKPTS